MAVDNDPRPVLRQELARVFKNQRVIRAFEKIFDLIPPEFINQQIQIDTLDLLAGLASSQSTEALAAIQQLTSAIERLAVAPPVVPVLPPDDLTPRPAIPESADTTGSITLLRVNGVELSYMRSDASLPLDQSIAPTWTGQHIFSLTTGIGAAPNPWGNLYRALDVAATGASYAGSGYSSYVGCNTYNDNANWVRVGATFGPSLYSQFNGTHEFFGDAAGAAASTYTPTKIAGFDRSVTATHTRFLIYDVDTATLARVTVGAPNSGGAGFKLLRVPN